MTAPPATHVRRNSACEVAHCFMHFTLVPITRHAQVVVMCLVTAVEAVSACLLLQEKAMSTLLPHTAPVTLYQVIMQSKLLMFCSFMPVCILVKHNSNP